LECADLPGALFGRDLSRPFYQWRRQAGADQSGVGPPHSKGLSVCNWFRLMVTDDSITTPSPLTIHFHEGVARATQSIQIEVVFQLHVDVYRAAVFGGGAEAD
jgi:hypothetical protein